MKWPLVITIFAVAACSGFAGEKKNQKEPVAKKVNRSFSSVALLELFTSEGCSSCPPADRLLPQLAGLDSNVIPISFHVDYWNHLGWTDPFSKVEFSERQRKYGDRFQLESIYTPQLIVNGEYELVGSNRRTAEADIKKALNEKPGVQIKIDEIKKVGNKLSISCYVEGDFKQANLIAVLVQKTADIKVKGGENGGKKLSHINIVRSFLERACQQKMNFEIDKPQDLADNNSQLILFTQQKDLKITGAAVYSYEL